jgi:hypothetical protein
VQCDRYIQPRVEPEIAFLLGRDLEGPNVTAAQVLSATDAVFGAIDVLDSRYAGYKFTFNDVTADNASPRFRPRQRSTRHRPAPDRLRAGKNGELVPPLQVRPSWVTLPRPWPGVRWLSCADRACWPAHRHGGGMTEAVALPRRNVARFDRLGTVEIPFR